MVGSVLVAVGSVLYGEVPMSPGVSILKISGFFATALRQATAKAWRPRCCPGCALCRPPGWLAAAGGGSCAPRRRRSPRPALLPRWRGTSQPLSRVVVTQACALWTASSGRWSSATASRASASSAAGPPSVRGKGRTFSFPAHPRAALLPGCDIDMVTAHVRSRRRGVLLSPRSRHAPLPLTVTLPLTDRAHSTPSLRASRRSRCTCTRARRSRSCVLLRG